MSERRMVGVPPSAGARRPRGGATPSGATPSRSSARSAKRPKKEEPEDDEEEKRQSEDEEEKNPDSEEEEEEEDDDSDAEVEATPVRKGRGPGKRKRGTAKLTDYHLKKKSIMARKAQREAEREKEREENGGQLLKEKKKEEEKEKVPARKAPIYSEFTPLQLLLDHILRKIVAKDPEGYFATPVTKSVAPDYHEIVKEPMDFQTVREKIEDNKYDSMTELQKDCELIVTNAMAYNQQNTVFYLAAARLKTLINYYFGEQYLRFVFHSLPFAKQIPLEKAGLTPLAPLPKASLYINKRKNALVDDLTSDQLLENVDSKIRGKLAPRKPNAKLAFLSEKDGTMVLNVLSDETLQNREKKVTLGDIIGPLEEGTPGLIQLGEHRLYSQSPINYLNYGPFASFAPQYDSTWATMTKEDSDLFLRTYGDKTNAVEAMSMKAFVADSGEFMMRIVDDMLDSLTNGEHSKVLKETGEKKEDENDRKLREYYAQEVAMNGPLQLIDDVSTLSNLGIDVGFLNDVRSDLYNKPKEPQENGICHMNTQQQLNHIGQGIQDLAHLQQNRLQQQPPPSLIHVQEAGSVEQKLAENVQQQLVQQVSTLTQPSDLVSAPVLHDAMGMEFDDDLMSEFFVTT
ncbi:unnamed protein product [Caenorhabditis angaria]|uniref:Bromo domain-containing protein n=1 Tax=Caenorhabditis angaria TaxID=860376 RepID=A0A9P1I3W3_9PELO|nr:unnamed protein product [Caenorhabditis angaria]